jgi:hypothetical protein
MQRLDVGTITRLRRALGRQALRRRALDMLRAWSKRDARPAIYAAVLLMMGASVLALHFADRYDSDYVAGIVTLQNWRLAGGHTAWLPADTFVLKVPFYLLVQSLLPNSPLALLAIALLINAAAFALFFLAHRILVGRRPHLAAYTPLLLLGGLGPTFYLTLREPNCRNIEIGVAFVCLALIVRYLAGQLTIPSGARGLAMLAGAGAALGLFIYDDPLIVFVLVAPLAIVLIARYLVLGGRQTAGVVVFLGAACAAAPLWSGVFRLLHVSAASQRMYFVGLDQLGGHVYLAFAGLLRMQNADFFGQPVMDVHTFPALINFGLLALTFAAPVIFWLLRRPLAWWQWLVVLQPHFFVATFIVSAQVYDLGAARYLVFEPFFAVIILWLLIEAVAIVRLRYVLQGLIVASCLLNLGLTAPTLLAGYQNPNAHDQAVVRVVRQYGLTKGYADYWSANIHTYLSGNAIQFIAARCGPHGMYPYLFNMDDRALQAPAARTFYLVDRTTQGSEACTLDEVRRQLGASAQTVAIDSQSELLIYNGDITARMAPGRHG